MAEGEEMSVERFQELEDMVANLLAAARKLPPGHERQEALAEISRFRLRISDLKNAKSNKAQ